MPEDLEFEEGDVPDEDIPEYVKRKWEEDEKKGLRAGVCGRCGFTFGQDELSCPHCGAPVEMKTGVFPAMKHFFLRTPMGIVLLVIVLFSLVLLLAFP
jgi:rubredoxin